MAVLGLRFCARAFSSCGKRGPLLTAVRGPLTVAVSLVAEHRLQMRRLSNCGSRAQLLRGTWDLPRPGLEPVSPALSGGFSTTAPPGKPRIPFFNLILLPLHLLVYGCVCVCVYQIRSHVGEGPELCRTTAFLLVCSHRGPHTFWNLLESFWISKLTWSCILVFRAGTSAFLCLDHLLITDTVKQALLSFSVYFVVAVHPLVFPIQNIFAMKIFRIHWQVSEK